MQERRGDGDSSSLSPRRGGHLPPLAPRDPRPTSSRDRASGSSTGRPARLSHRSRAGCWTCRGRKVKCDEIHPRCGPCTRLNRECDWDHRWNFNDATISTQGKHSNVKTTGNAVWDPTVRRRHSTSNFSRQYDDLPDFAALTTDEDRERKAGTQRPGTFGVVVTPESFHDLPEYASAAPSSARRTSGGSAHSSGRGGHRSPEGLRRAQTLPADPNTVLLDRFEDASPTTTIAYTTVSNGDGRRGSYPEGLSQLTIATPTYSSSGIRTAPQTPIMRLNDHHLVRHFRDYLVHRLVQPQQEPVSGVFASGASTGDVFEREAAHFQPLHHAICAISALNLADSGRSSLEEAMQHYHQALAASATATSPNDLPTDGVFFRHFLLFVYDICIPMQTNDDGADMWAKHLEFLESLAIQRHHSRHEEPSQAYAYVIWTICELDMYACLMGSGYCTFLGSMLSHNMLPPLEYQIPSVETFTTGGGPGQASSTNIPFLPYEAPLFPSILHLNQGIVLRAAKIAQTAQTFRSEQARSGPPSPGTRARWQATTTQLQADLLQFWAQNSPSTSTRLNNLPTRIQHVLQNATALYYATTLYARTSIFPTQRSIPSYRPHDPPTESLVSSIFALASSSMSRKMVFPLFMAGFATSNPDAKIVALDLMKRFEAGGIGRNTARTRRLLEEVCEEQRKVLGGMESVDWWVVAGEKGLGVVNCGL